LKALFLLVAGFSLATVAERSTAESAHWTYAGDHGPAHWAELSAEYAACGIGVHQSPIDIDNPIAAELPPLRYDYQSIGTTIVNNGHTLQISAAPGSRLIVDDESFALQQLHFHSPSEHHINGEAFLMEAHFVHQNTEGDLAVVAVLYRQGPQNEVLATLGQLAPEEVGSVSNLEFDFKLISDRTNPASYYRYTGSLTTPPCTEGVRWFVSKSIHTISVEQRDEFVELIGEDARGPQPLNSRLVLER
jgi:carbonic anhydrase